jgi:O-antigen/teichoic acid export membrane protein
MGTFGAAGPAGRSMVKGRTSIARSVVFTLARRWLDRLIGIISTIILARLLVPADFGVIAMATLVLGLVDVFLDLGVNIALIQRSNPTPEQYNTAWTLRLIQTSIATLVVVATAPLAASYFKDPRVEPVLQVLGFAFVLSALENIGVVEFQTHMRFGEDFRFAFLKRLAGFAATVIAAWVMRSYWALVVGTLAGRAFGVVISYFVHPMRPRLTLRASRDIFAVSQWVMVQGIGGFLNQQLHRWVVARRESADVLGAYTLAGEICALPQNALLMPLNRVLFPAFVQVKADPDELRRIFLLAQGVQALVAIPVFVGLALVADEAVRLALGDKWLSVVPFVEWLAPFGAMSAINTSAGYVLMALGHFRVMSIFSWVSVAAFVAIVYLVLPGAGALQIIWVRVMLGTASFLAFLLLVRQTVPHLRDSFAGIGRPLLGAAIMAAAVLAVAWMVKLPFQWMLLVKMLVGAVTYAGAVLLLWLAAGRPDGAEAYLLRKLRARRA